MLHITKLVLVSIVIWQWSVAKPALSFQGLVVLQWKSTGLRKEVEELQTPEAGISEDR